MEHETENIDGNCDMNNLYTAADSVTSTQHLPSHQRKEIMSIQNTVKDRSIVVTGGSFTAEAWDFDRKMRIHEQLKLARRIRCKMEQACEEAMQAQNKKEVRKIFLNHEDDMLQLVSLTDAVLGGYTLDSYDEYIQMQKEQTEREEKDFQSSQEALNSLRQNIAWEHAPLSFLRDNKEIVRQQRINDRNESNSTKVISEKKKISEKNIEPSVMYVRGLTKPETKSTFSGVDLATNPSPTSTVTKKQKTSKNASPKKCNDDKKATKMVSGRATSTSARAVPKNQSTNVSKIPTSSKPTTTLQKIPKILKIPNGLGTCKPSTIPVYRSDVSFDSPKSKGKQAKSPSSQTSNTESRSKGKSMKGKNKAARKCHYCRQSVTSFNTCGYWHITGNKCKKIFCSDCLPKFGMVITLNSDWHCPSCVGKCDCSTCAKERERESMRNASKRRRLRA